MKFFSKPKLIIISILILLTENLWSQKKGFDLLELYFDTSVNVPKKVYEEHDKGLSTAKFIAGFKLVDKHLDFRFYQGTKNFTFNTFSHVYEFSDFKSKILKKPAWSLSFDVENFSKAKSKVPLTFYFGTLSYGQTISQLNNPDFYSIPSAFGNISTFNYGLGIRLAQKSTSEKPFSFAASYETPKITIQTAISENYNFSLSSGFKFQSGTFLKNELSLALISFNLESKPQTSWKNTLPQFDAKKNYGMYLETNFSMPFFKAKLAGGALTNPNNALRFFATGECFFHYNNFALLAGIYSSDTPFYQNCIPFYTASSNVEKTLWQFKLNPQLSFFPKKQSCIKTGAAILYSSSLGEFGYKQNSLQKLTLNASIAGTFPADNFSVYFRLQNFLIGKLNGNNSHQVVPFNFQNIPEQNDITDTFGINYSHNFNRITLSLSAKETFTLDSNSKIKAHSETFSCSTRFKNFPITSTYFSAVFSHKNNIVSPKFTFGTSCSVSLKKVKISGKISLSTTLLVE